MIYLKRFIKKRTIWIRSQLIPQRSLILIYHRIGKVDKRFDPYTLTVSQKNFIDHLKILKNNYNIISLSELIHCIENNELSEKSVAITFDDGYEDNNYLVKPLLEEFKIPATFFLTSGYFGKLFWWDLLTAYLYNANSCKQIVLGGKAFTFNGDPKDIQRTIDIISLHIRSLNYMEKLTFIHEINSLNNNLTTLDLSRCMTEDDLKSFSKCPFVEIGVHTKHHFQLSSMSKEEQYNEIMSNKNELENITQGGVNLFAYPNGDYNQSTVNILKNNSFRCGVTGSLGVVHNGSDVFRLNRLSILNWNKNTFHLLLKYWL